MYRRYFKISCIFLLSLLFFQLGYAKTKSALPFSQKSFKLSHSPNGLLLESTDGNYSLNFHGYFQGDGVKFQHDAYNLTSGVLVRRARLGISGKVAKDWQYAFSYEFTGGGNIKNANIGYTGWNNMSLTIGQYYPQFSLSNEASNTALSIMEFPMVVNALAPGDYIAGLAYTVYSKQLALHLNAFGPGSSQSTQGRSPIGAAGRFVYSPIHTMTRVIDLGASGWHQKPNGSASVDFSSNPGADSPDSDTLINTGTITNVRYYDNAGVEAAFVYGPWSAQAEYIGSYVHRKYGQPNLHFEGYYVMGSYFFTGESRYFSYPSAEFTGITPVRHKYGAWQVALRFDNLNLNDKTTRGGKENNITVGLNWYVNNYILFQANYIRAMAHPASDGINRNVNIYAARMQVMF